MELIVNFTPTGMIPTKEMTPHVPITVDEIVEDVRRACGIGITMVHLHARDESTGAPTYRPEVYGAMIAGIREFAEDLVICVSLSGRTFSELEKRAAPLGLEGDVKPDMGSLTLTSLNFNRVASVSSPTVIQGLASEMARRGILPELEAFDIGFINYAKYLERKGLLEPPHYFNLLAGNIACAQATLLHVGLMINDLPPDSYWSLAGIGDAQLPMNAVGIGYGGGVRVGLEDNIYFDAERTTLARNADLIERVHRMAQACGRRVMAPRTLRELLRLETAPGAYGRSCRNAIV
jgi:uncharacterized protein (DUF849 family)